MEVKICNRQTDIQTDIQTDRLTDKFSDTIYRGVCGFFLSVKLATSLLTLLAGGIVLQI